ncbi:MAG: MBL fold metallo-hydrolase [Methanoregula sp.]|jgi:glyoxylase-like metal-dependent hydrolase (beta-lactamase superfamily II)
MQITPAIHALRHPFKIPVAPGIALDRFVYSYILAGETITLIDTGVAGCENAIFDYIRLISRDPREISLIILTHSHPDHIGAAKAIREATGCSVMAHPAERAWIEDVDRQNQERPVPGFSTLVGGSVQLDHELAEGDVIDTDGTEEYEIQVYHTPGHSAGSVSLLIQAERALFCGDSVPVEGDLPVYDDARQSVRSVKKIQAIRGIRVLLSAWDEPRMGDAAYRQMDRAIAYLQKIHETVIAVSADGTTDPMEIARRAAPLIGLPPQAVTPLLARTLAANMRASDSPDLVPKT